MKTKMLKPYPSNYLKYILKFYNRLKIFFRIKQNYNSILNFHFFKIK